MIAKTLFAFLALAAVVMAQPAPTIDGERVRITEIWRTDINAAITRIAFADDNSIIGVSQNALTWFNNTRTNTTEDWTIKAYNSSIDTLLNAAFYPAMPSSFVTIYYRAATAAEMITFPLAYAVNYTLNATGALVVERLDYNETSDSVSSTFITKFPVYNGNPAVAVGVFEIDADGNLWVALANQFPEQDIRRNAFTPVATGGKLLRLNPWGTAANIEIPSNPYYGTVGQGLVFASGFHRLDSITAVNGMVLAIDAGFQTDGEVNVIRPKYNYGFPVMEGTDCLQTCTPSDKVNLDTPAVFWWHEDPNAAVADTSAYRILNIGGNAVVFSKNTGAAVVSMDGARNVNVTDKRDILLGWYYGAITAIDTFQGANGSYFVGGWDSNASSILFKVEHINPAAPSSAGSAVVAALAMIVAVLALVF